MYLKKKNKFIIVSLICLSGSLHSMESTLKPVIASLREACLAIIEKNQSIQTVQEKHLSFICGNFDDHILRKELIKKLNPSVLETSPYTDSFTEQLIAHPEYFSSENFGLLLKKLPQSSFDVLKLLVFKPTEKDEIRTLLIKHFSDQDIQQAKTELLNLYLQTTTPHMLQCALMERIQELQTLDHVMKLASKGKISFDIAKIATNLFEPTHVSLMKEGQLYNDNTLKFGNEQLFIKAHYEKIYEQLNKITLQDNLEYDIRDYTQSLPSEQQPWIVAQENDQVVVYAKNTNQQVASYKKTLMSVEKNNFLIVPHPINNSIIAVISTLRNNSGYVIDIIDINKHKKMIRVLNFNHFSATCVAWSNDGEQIVLINENNNDIIPINAFQFFLTPNYDLYSLLKIRTIVENTQSAWLTINEEILNQLYNIVY